MITFAQDLTGNSHHVDGTWNGRGEQPKLRAAAAVEIAIRVIKHRKDNNLIKEPIFILGHSHGGNVAIEVMNLLDVYYTKIATDIQRPRMILGTLNTPRNYHNVLNNNLIEHYNIYAVDDIMSRIGQYLDFSLSYGQEYPQADMNIQYQDKTPGIIETWNHMGISKNNFDEWKPKFDANLQKVEEQSKVFLEKDKNLYDKNKDRKSQEDRSTKKDNTDVKILSPRNF